MSTLAEYLDSPDFGRFADETLRTAACEAVNAYLDEQGVEKAADPHQLYTLQGVVAGTGLGGLRNLAAKQKERNTSKKNQAFWAFLAERIAENSPREDAFFSMVRTELETRGLLADEAAGEKKEQKDARRANRDRVDYALGRALPVLVEHFVCDYAYEVAMRKGG